MKINLRKLAVCLSLAPLVFTPWNVITTTETHVIAFSFCMVPPSILRGALGDLDVFYPTVQRESVALSLAAFWWAGIALAAVSWRLLATAGSAKKPSRPADIARN